MKSEQPKVLNVLERMGMVRKSEETETPAEQTVETAELDQSSEQPGGAPYTEAAEESSQALNYQFESEPEPDPIYKPADYTPPAYTGEERWIKSEVGEKMNEASFWDDSPALNTDTDRFMEVEDIYRALNLKGGGTDTIYLVEEYMKTLPDSLPAESRRAIIMKIVGASGFDFDKLLNDGIDRVTKLNEYAATFAQQTDKIVARHNSELDALEKQIQRVRELIGERKNLHKRQFLAIENEAQRLKEVLDFVTK